MNLLKNSHSNGPVLAGKMDTIAFYRSVRTSVVCVCLLSLVVLGLGDDGRVFAKFEESVAEQWEAVELTFTAQRDY